MEGTHADGMRHTNIITAVAGVQNIKTSKRMTPQSNKTSSERVSPHARTSV